MPAAKLLPESASERLENSRKLLRLALTDYQTSGALENASERASEFKLLADLSLLKAKPGAYVLAQTLLHAWKKNPWYILGQNASEVADIMLAPIARRSPIKLVTGAFVVGGLIFLTQPWRLVTKSGLITALLRR